MRKLTEGKQKGEEEESLGHLSLNTSATKSVGNEFIFLQSTSRTPNRYILISILSQDSPTRKETAIV